MVARALFRLMPRLFTAVLAVGCTSSDAAPATSGVGGSSGGGSGTTGAGGTTGVAGAAGVAATSGGVAGASVGVAGTNGVGGSAGNTGGGAQGGSGTAGSVGCSELVATAFQAKADGSVQAAIAPTLGGAEPDFFLVELVDGATGTFDLGVNPDANYKTCDHCLSVFEDANAVGTPARRYYQSKGSITVTVADPGLTGKSAGSVTDLTLVEVTLAGGGDFTSTPVPGGKCLHVAAVAWDTTK